jgi:RNA polymerase sigma-70 factor (ECF subfamily)
MIRMMSRESDRPQAPVRPSGDAPSEDDPDEPGIVARVANTAAAASVGASTGRETPQQRLRRVVDDHHDALWRTLRYLGVPDANVDDAAQQALCVLARRLNDVVPGTERTFLFATAVRVASDARRAARRSRSLPVEDIDRFTGSTPSAEELVDERKAREVLRQVLASLPEELRVVFVFYEVEELGLSEIAALIGIPVGTVSSRLRRARERFQAIVRRRQATNESLAKAKGKVRP